MNVKSNISSRRIINFYIFKSSDDKITFEGVANCALSRFRCAEFKCLYNLSVPFRTQYLHRPDSPSGKEGEGEIDKKARLYNRKAYPIPDFQIIRCCSMPCGAFWKWIDPFESNLINTRLCALPYTWSGWYRGSKGIHEATRTRKGGKRENEE